MNCFNPKSSPVEIRFPFGNEETWPRKTDFRGLFLATVQPRLAVLENMTDIAIISPKFTLLFPLLGEPQICLRYQCTQLKTLTASDSLVTCLRLLGQTVLTGLCSLPLLPFSSLKFAVDAWRHSSLLVTMKSRAIILRIDQILDTN